ncbi:PREDICTED: uncharacterized protein LOC105459329 isoform X2 [Wasmannia auropunctata]|uniref:uncharacterized protein LOC105459329 isoform X2 n=1 Tax=Wasmannia auropunctata TaxID=64793 RepID=UPI0005EFD5C7|nr:PREDICTED: uncharacterized protein LOC105459329 isoform X2 [Wasmannia auropunctata]
MVKEVLSMFNITKSLLHKERRRANFCSSVTVTSTPMLEAEFRSLKRACMSASACQPDLLSTRSLDELKTL